MEIKKFLNEYIYEKRADNHTIEIVSLEKSDEVNNVYNELICMKGFIKNVNFDCKVNNKGGCKNNPVFTKCCCYACKSSIGYIRMMPKELIKYYARYYNGKTGFWRKGKGCIIPHHRRSIICLTHHCNYEEKGYKYFSKGFMEFKSLMLNRRNSLLDNWSKAVLRQEANEKT